MTETDWELYRGLLAVIEAADKSERLDRLNAITPDRSGDDSKFVVMFVFSTLEEDWPAGEQELLDRYRAWLIELRDEMED